MNLVDYNNESLSSLSETLYPAAMVLGWSIGKGLATIGSKKQLPDIADVIFENGILYIKNASAILNGSVLEVK